MRFTRQLLSALLGALASVSLLLTAGLLTAVPASAHDAAESSSPADGATVATAPEKVSITFNNIPLGLGSQVKVTDAAGTDWADGKVEIVDNVASQKLREGAPAGKYTVVWRVVSSDSHPIEGTFAFTATAAAAGATTAPAATTAPVATAGTPQPGQTQATETAPDSAEPFPWSIVIFAAVALGLLVILGILARRKLSAGDNDGAHGPGGHGA
ncbi:copper resistance protein CopC [Arthrobacter sp. NPDC057009]|uniref:copper resistance CopC family protein n=1 Tax=Arthrobacter sp. NPDC057009 TaxID=3345996 RepID=UPI0036374B82